MKQNIKEYNKLRVRRNKEYIRLYKETHTCEICGESRAMCLDFHHKNPNIKRFDLSEAKSVSIDSIDTEIAKCLLVCANCHRILHAEDIRTGLANAASEELLPLFDRIGE